MKTDYNNLIKDVESGSAFVAFEAAKKLAHNTLSKTDINQLAYIAIEGSEVHNREAAVYALSWLENNYDALEMIINILASTQNHEQVRGQAAEGIGIIWPSNRNRLRKTAEDVLIKSLKDSSPTVRFWSCYAAGQIKLKKALPILNELKTNDHEVCPDWWYVSEEAEDAIESIHGRNGKDRIPLRDRDSTEPNA